MATPAAIVPTPRLATSFTPIRASRVDRSQIRDQLGKILDRVDVVVRGWADVALTGLAAAKRGDIGGSLAAGQLTAFSGLGALGDLDLQLIRPGKVGGGDAEAGGGDLLDPGIAATTVRAGCVPGRILAALTGVGGAARSLDPDGQGLVCLGTQRADAHGRDDESSDDGRARPRPAPSGVAAPARLHPEIVARHGSIRRRGDPPRPDSAQAGYQCRPTAMPSGPPTAST